MALGGVRPSDTGKVRPSGTVNVRPNETFSLYSSYVHIDCF